jgi:hypothetical protein
MRSIDASEFLSLIWPQKLLRNETLELRAIKRSDKTISRRFLKSPGEFLQVASAFGTGWDIYYGIATRHEKGGKKEDCSRVCCVWADLDHVDKLPDFKKVQPDIVVNSGGGYHIYWLLETPIYVRTGRWKEIESINRGLLKKFGGDPMTPDISRILRVPGFFNYKYTPARKVTANAV